MSSIANNGIITIHRGDNIDYPIFINRGTKLQQIPYFLAPGDILYISICEANQPFNHGVIRKMLTSEDTDIYNQVHFTIIPSDTENLKPGIYYYEIKLKLTNDKQTTIVPRQRFIILE